MFSIFIRGSIYDLKIIFAAVSELKEHSRETEVNIKIIEL